MDKTDNAILTNQPETRSILPLVSSRPAEMDESEIFVFGRVGDGGVKWTEVEAAMTPAVLRLMALGTGGVVPEGGRSNSR
eukprot:scaffold51541_cov105-Cyclotella_meneghiniana.AAC.1